MYLYNCLYQLYVYVNDNKEVNISIEYFCDISPQNYRVKAIEAQLRYLQKSKLRIIRRVISFIKVNIKFLQPVRLNRYSLQPQLQS